MAQLAKSLDEFEFKTLLTRLFD